MEKSVSVVPGSRQLNLIKSFKRSIRSLLTACSDEEFLKAFPGFTDAEKGRIRGLFNQIITTGHENIEREFDSIFTEIQAGKVFDSVDELVEEHNLDQLYPRKSNIGELVQTLSESKKQEIDHLRGLLENAEEQNRTIRARLEVIKREKQDMGATEKFLHELSTTISNYDTHSSLPGI